MKILHICNDLYGSKVHANLYENLVGCKVEQSLFVPLRKGVDTSSLRLSSSVELHKVEVVKPYHRFLYHVKRMRVFKALCGEVDLKRFDIIHATTLFSDGGVAYKAHRKVGVPYMVTVRNTDVNGFLRLLPHTWFSGWRILMHAERIAFVSKAIMDRFEKSWVIRPILSRIKDKFVLQCNGLDDYWCDHLCREAIRNHKVLYVGDFSNNKNVKRLIEAILSLRRHPQFSDLTLTLVGGGRMESEVLPRLIDAHKDCISFLGPVKDRSRLCEIYREHSIFAMPSIHETFGLAYVEALSQNLAILYTQGQGVDGLFDKCAGVGVNPYSVRDIEAALSTLLEHRDEYTNEKVNFEQFRWRMIADRYKMLYQSILDDVK